MVIKIKNPKYLKTGLIRLKSILQNNYIFLIVITITNISILYFPFVCYSDACSSWFNPFFNLGELFSPWDTYGGIGHDTPNNLTSVTLRLFYGAISVISTNPVVIQKLAWIIFLNICISLIYIINVRILKNKIKSLTLTLITFFNPLTLYFLWNKQHWAYYLVVPYYLGTLITLSLVYNFSYKKAFAVAVIWLIFGFAFNQPAYIAPFFIIQFVLFTYGFFKSRSKITYIKEVLITVLIFVAVNAVYILPLLATGSSTLTATQSAYGSNDPLPILHDTQNSGFASALLGNTKGYGDYFLSTNVSSVLLLPIYILIICSFIFKLHKAHYKEEAHLKILFLLTVLIFIFFFKGLNEPFSNLSEIIYSFKPAYIFRDYKDKFALGLSTAFIFVLFFIIKNMKLRYAYYITPIPLLYFSLFILQVWLPTNYTNSSNLANFNKINLPKDTGSYRILNLPLVDYSFYYSSNPNYAADNPLKNLLSWPVIYSTEQKSSTSISELKDRIEDYSITDQYLSNFLDEYSIKYVLINKNSYVKEQYNKYINLSNIESSRLFTKFYVSNDIDVLMYDNPKRIITGNIKSSKLNNSTYLLTPEESSAYFELNDSYNQGWNIYELPKPCIDLCSNPFILYFSAPLLTLANPIYSSHNSYNGKNTWSFSAKTSSKYILIYSPIIIASSAIAISVLSTGTLFYILYIRKRRDM